MMMIMMCVNKARGEERLLRDLPYERQGDALCLAWGCRLQLILLPTQIWRSG